MLDRLQADLDSIEDAIDAARFEAVTNPPGITAYEGTANNWRILVAMFVRNDGSVGYDGTAQAVSPEGETIDGVHIVRLTPELAKKAALRAREQVAT